MFFYPKMLEKKQEGHRAGIIPYYIIEDKIVIGLGVDTKSGDLTDFGGGIKKEETIFSGAFREFKEESGEYFKNIKKIDNHEIVTIMHNDHMTIFFLPIKEATKSTLSEKPISNEIKEIRWFYLDSIKDNLDKIRLWEKVKNFLEENIGKKFLDFDRILREKYHGHFL